MAANLKEVRGRIKSVISTQQITKAMKMVSAAKLRRAQQNIQQMRPYAERLNKMMRNIMSFSDGEGAEQFAIKTEKKKPLVVVVTSDRGLCGAFNTNILKLATKFINDNYAEQRKFGSLSILFVGKKGFDFFKRRFADCKLMDQYVATYNGADFNQISQVSSFLMKEFLAGNFDQIDIFYSRFKNAGTQFPEHEQFLPVAKVSTPAGNTDKKLIPNYTFEPSQEELLKELVPSILQTQFFKSVIDTTASEHGARMTAMDKASENAENMLGELRINYNKARQEAITKELSEIVGGAAALNG